MVEVKKSERAANTLSEELDTTRILAGMEFNRAELLRKKAEATLATCDILEWLSTESPKLAEFDCEAAIEAIAKAICWGGEGLAEFLKSKQPF